MYTINEELKQSVLSSIPRGYSNLEKALHVYKTLCERLDYSLDYYLDEGKYAPWYCDSKNLSLIDGKTRNDVVCYTFCGIYLEILKELGLCNDSTIKYNLPNKAGKFRDKHHFITLIIDGIEYEIDATDGIMVSDDLTHAKYGTGLTFKGWKILSEHSRDHLRRSIDKVSSSDFSFETNVCTYTLQKAGEFIDYPLEKRKQVFLNAVKSAPDYSLASFSYLRRLKHACFTGPELVGERQHFELLFVKDDSTKEYRALALFNPEGYTDEGEGAHIDQLEIYDISVLNKDVARLDFQGLREKFQQRRYVKRNGTPETLPQMARTKSDELANPPGIQYITKYILEMVDIPEKEVDARRGL